MLTEYIWCGNILKFAAQKLNAKQPGSVRKGYVLKPSTGTWKEGMGDQAGEKGETEEARAETGTGKASVRQNREEKERKNRG